MTDRRLFSKRLLSLLLALALAMSVLPVSALAAAPAASDAYSGVYVEPAYREYLTEEDIPTFEEARSAEISRRGIVGYYVAQLFSSGTYGSIDSAAAAVRAQLVARSSDQITVSFVSPTYMSGLDDTKVFLYNYVCKHTGRPDEGDYLHWHLGGYRYSCYSQSQSDGTYLVTVSLTSRYLTTAAQEAEVTSRVSSIVSSLGLRDSTKTQYARVRSIYEWLVDNCQYDHMSYSSESLEDLKHSAYGVFCSGKAVCQGYASAFYRLCLEAGIDARTISGNGNGGGHGWNIVKLGRYYYVLDATWDSQGKHESGRTSWNYFLIDYATFTNGTLKNGTYVNNHNVWTIYNGNYYTPYWSDYYPNRISTAAYTEQPGSVPSLSASRSGTAINLNWEEAVSADAYSLGFSTDGGSSWTALVNTRSTSYYHSGLTPGLTYLYRIFAYNGAYSGSYSYSNSVAIPPLPANVTGFTATQKAAGKMTLTWSSAANAARYRIDRRTGSGDWVTLTSSVSGTSYTDSTVKAGTAYTYRVYGVNEIGLSASPATSAQITALAAPSNVRSLTTTMTAGKITVKWSRPANSPLFHLQRQVDGGNWVGLSTELSGTSYEDTNVTAGKTYAYRIRGRNGNLYGSVWKESAAVTMLATPAAVSTLTGTIADGKIVVKWSAATGAKQYQLQRSVNGGAWTNVSSELTGTSYNDTAVAVGSTYRYRIRGRNTTVYGTSWKTMGATLTMLATPGAISSLTATASAGKITVKWSASKNAKQYHLQRQVGSGGWAGISSVLTGTTYEDTDVTAGKTYTYRVRGRNGSLFGTAWKTGTAIAMPATPAAVSTLTATVSNGAIALKWSKAADAKQYQLQRSVDGGAWANVSSALTGVSYTDPNVKLSTTYQYRIRGRNGTVYGTAWATSGKVRMLATPGAISSLTATVGTGAITVKWTGSANAKQYHMQRSVNGGGWSGVSTELTGTSYTDRDVVKDKTYAYRVRGRNETVYGAWKESAAVKATSTSAPGEIATMTATLASADRMTLSWSKATNASQYHLQKQTDGGSWTGVSSTLTATSYADTAVSAGHSYAYRVRGREGSAYGAWKTSETVVDPLVPASVSALSVTVSGGAVTLKWSAAASAAQYQLQRSVDGGAWTTLASSLTGLTYTDSSVPANTPCRYRIRAKSVNAYGGWTQSRTVAAFATPASIDECVGHYWDSNGGVMSVFWNCSGANTTAYHLQMRIDGGAWQDLSRTLTAKTYQVPDPSRDHTYQFRVRGVNGEGTDAAYGPWATSGTAEVPKVPGSMSVSANYTLGGYIAFGWGSNGSWSPDATTYYQIRRRINGGAWQIIESHLTATSYTTDLLTPGSVYEYEVRGCSAYGESEIWNSINSSAPIVVPEDVVFNNYSLNSPERRITLWWRSSSGSYEHTAGWKIYRNGAQIAYVTVASGSTQSYIDYVPASGTYSYSIQPISDFGYGSGMAGQTYSCGSATV